MTGAESTYRERERRKKQKNTDFSGFDSFGPFVAKVPAEGKADEEVRGRERDFFWLFNHMRDLVSLFNRLFFRCVYRSSLST